jgi:hypothetical protein
MTRLFVLGLLVALSGCVSTHMKQFVGKDIREVMIEDGPPVAQFDLADGRRAFQWHTDGVSFTTPQYTTGTMNQIGAATFVNATTTGGQTITSSGCYLTYIARQDDTRAAWIVEDYRYPDRLFC